MRGIFYGYRDLEGNEGEMIFILYLDLRVWRERRRRRRRRRRSTSNIRYWVNLTLHSISFASCTFNLKKSSPHTFGQVSMSPLLSYGVIKVDEKDGLI